MDIPQINKEEWNMARDWLYSLSSILNDCIRAQIREDGYLWYKNLLALYTMVKCKLPKESKDKAETMMNDIINQVNSHKKHISPKLLREFELFMRQELDNKGLLTPKSDDDPYNAFKNG